MTAPTPEQISAVLRHLAARGGRVKSAAKAEACRRNGRKGGRPKKLKTQEATT